ncbi:hypothetical protein B296_00026525 [Ensete ventricosum]|uniref:Retrotransposon gag domain-containing protein n=1 Tax=Ensete ventricosum TaxID=4639 RepID=A0A426ZYP6_ENSVE|nr:hypothetical protein B296_00026525 [Ensete ventricosum]
MLQKANQYITVEALVEEKREDQKRLRAESSQGPPPGLPRKRTERAEQAVPQLSNILLNSTWTEIFLQIQEKGLLKTPNPIRTRAEERDHGRYCHFHRDYEQDTEECSNLKNQIEDLIHRGHLAKRPRARGDPEITFESESEYPDHDDALVITACIANTRVRRIMINTGSSVDILYLNAFQKLSITNQDLIPMILTLTGFIRDVITPVGIVTLPMTFGDEPRTKTFMVPFMVVKLPSAYNMIIRRPTLDKRRAVVSTYHRSIKFPTSAGPGEVRSDSQESRRCYLMTTVIPKRGKKETLVYDSREPWESPYSLTFDTEVVLSPEVVFPTLRIENFTPEA